MESQPQNHEFRNNPENFHQCTYIRICVIDEVLGQNLDLYTHYLAVHACINNDFTHMRNSKICVKAAIL